MRSREKIEEKKRTITIKFDDDVAVRNGESRRAEVGTADEKPGREFNEPNAVFARTD